MSDNKPLLKTMLLGLVLLLAGDVLFVWPSIRAARTAREEIVRVKPMLADLSAQRRIVFALEAELEEQGRRLAELAGLPAAGADLEAIRVPIERAGVEAGIAHGGIRLRAAPDSGGGPLLSERSRCIVVDVTSSFVPIFTFIRRLELMTEPIRVARVQIEGCGAEQIQDAPTLSASIDLELTGVVRLDPENE